MGSSLARATAAEVAAIIEETLKEQNLHTFTNDEIMCRANLPVVDQGDSETVSRALQNLKRKGIIVYRGSRRCYSRHWEYLHHVKPVEPELPPFSYTPAQRRAKRKKRKRA